MEEREEGSLCFACCLPHGREGERGEGVRRRRGRESEGGREIVGVSVLFVYCLQLMGQSGQMISETNIKLRNSLARLKVHRRWKWSVACARVQRRRKMRRSTPQSLIAACV